MTQLLKPHAKTNSAVYICADDIFTTTVEALVV